MAYKVTTKIATEASPFQMVYGTQLLLSTEYRAPTYQTFQPKDYIPHQVLAAKIHDVQFLEEIRELSIQNIKHKQQLSAKHF